MRRAPCACSCPGRSSHEVTPLSPEGLRSSITERMLTMSTTLITSNDPKGLHFIGLCAAAYNLAKLDESQAQKLNEQGDDLQVAILDTIHRIAFSTTSQERA